MLSRKENSALRRLFKETAPEMFTRAMDQVAKIRTRMDISRVPEIKSAFDLCGYSDNRLFLAVVFKTFHPAMYRDDCASLTLKQGLCKAVADQIGMKESNCSVLFSEVRTWLRCDMYDYRAMTDEASANINDILITISKTPTLFA